MNHGLTLVCLLALVLTAGMGGALDSPQGDVEKLRQAVAAVPEETRERFDQRFAAWQATWNKPPLMFSSNSADYAKSPEFFALAGMGKDILPLVVNKLRQPNMFFALHLYYKLQDDLSLIGTGFSEQEKAAMTVRLWLTSLPAE